MCVPTWVCCSFPGALLEQAGVLAADVGIFEPLQAGAGRRTGRGHAADRRAVLRAVSARQHTGRVLLRHCDAGGCSSKAAGGGPSSAPTGADISLVNVVLHKDSNCASHKTLTSFAVWPPLCNTISCSKVVGGRSGLVLQFLGDGSAAKHAAQQCADRGPDAGAAHRQRQLRQGVQGPVARPACGSQGERYSLTSVRPVFLLLLPLSGCTRPTSQSQDNSACLPVWHTWRITTAMQGLHLSMCGVKRVRHTLVNALLITTVHHSCCL